MQVEDVAEVFPGEILGQHLGPGPDPADRDRPRELSTTGCCGHGASLPAPRKAESGIERCLSRDQALSDVPTLRRSSQAV